MEKFALIDDPRPQELKDDKVKVNKFFVERATEYDRVHCLRMVAKREAEAKDAAPSEKTNCAREKQGRDDQHLKAMEFFFATECLPEAFF